MGDVRGRLASRIYVPSSGPNSWRALLADPDKHWRPGYSAHALAVAWETADRLPPEIATLFGCDADLLLAIPEHKVPLPGGRRESQNDLFALLRDGQRTVALMVEGKVAEPFGPVVSEWLKDASPGKQERLAYLCKALGIDASSTGDLHYQLLHRAVSAAIEAGRFKTDEAAMIVHSFHPDRLWFDSFAKFVGRFGLEVTVGKMVHATLPTGLRMGFGWACGDSRGG